MFKNRTCWLIQSSHTILDQSSMVETILKSQIGRVWWVVEYGGYDFGWENVWYFRTFLRFSTIFLTNPEISDWSSMVGEIDPSKMSYWSSLVGGRVWWVMTVAVYGR